MTFRVKNIVPLALFCAFFIFSAPSPAAAATVSLEEAKTTAEAADALEAATVNLYCRVDAGKNIMSVSGSGVIIDSRGVILTNAHVAQYFLLPKEDGRITADCSVRTGSPAKEAYTASMLYFPATWISENERELSKNTPRGTGDNDFALLYITDTKREALPAQFPSLTIDLQTARIAQEELTLLGYPSEGQDFKETQDRLALVSATSTLKSQRGFVPGPFTDLLTVAHSPLGASGASGGPIVDTERELVGIIVGKSTSKENRLVRGITLPYINRTLMQQTGLPLSSILAGDFALRARITELLLPEDTLSTLTKTILQKR